MKCVVTECSRFAFHDFYVEGARAHRMFHLNQPIRKWLTMDNKGEALTDFFDLSETAGK